MLVKERQSLCHHGPDMAGAGFAGGWWSWGSAGPVLHLAHANGFPPDVYRRFAEALAGRYRVVAAPLLPLRPGTDPASVSGWEPLAEDLRAQLRGAGLSDLIGVGHSLGAVITAMAAADDPGLFRALVLVEPVLFTGVRSFLWALTKRLGRADRFFLTRRAANRRDHWPSREQVLASWSARAVFSGWAPGVLEDYVAGGTVEDPGGGVRLVYPKTWEARLFSQTPHDVWPVIRRLGMPVLVVRGTTSDTFLAAAARRFQRVLPTAEVVELPCGHLVPMERPGELAALTLSWLERIGR